MALDLFNAPPLPNPPREWDAQYMQQVIRVLGVYFSQLDSRTPNNAQKYTADQFVGGTFSGNGVGIEVPYAQFIRNTDQTAASIADANVLAYDVSDFTRGITLVSGSRITIAAHGVYNITFSIQLQNTINGTETVDIWLRKNGVDIANTNSQFSLAPRKSATVPSAIIAITPLMLTLADNDYVEIIWRVSDTGVSIQHLPAVTASGTTPAIPATPSAFVQVQFVSHA